MARREICGDVQRFPGERGWFYLPLSEELCALLNEDVREAWPALLKADCSIGETHWSGTIMPIKNGPLFVSLPAKVRKAEDIYEGKRVRLNMNIT